MFFFFKQKTAYEMRISDWSSDVCSSDLEPVTVAAVLDESSLERRFDPRHLGEVDIAFKLLSGTGLVVEIFKSVARLHHHPGLFRVAGIRSEEHTSELQSLMRISYAVFCLKKKTSIKT